MEAGRYNPLNTSEEPTLNESNNSGQSENVIVDEIKEPHEITPEFIKSIINTEQVSSADKLRTELSKEFNEKFDNTLSRVSELRTALLEKSPASLDAIYSFYAKEIERYHELYEKERQKNEEFRKLIESMHDNFVESVKEKNSKVDRIAKASLFIVVVVAILAKLFGPDFIKSVAVDVISAPLIEEVKTNAAKIAEFRDQSERNVEKSKTLLNSLQPPYEQLTTNVVGVLAKNQELRKNLVGAPGPKGDTGPQGATGAQGSKGDKGDTVILTPEKMTDLNLKKIPDKSNASSSNPARMQ